jgi:hypothetical protein
MPYSEWGAKASIVSRIDATLSRGGKLEKPMK